MSAPPVLLPVAGDPTVSVALWFGVGSQDDPPGREGLAYLTGLMLAEAGTRDLPYETILTRLYPLAAGYGVRVDKEMTVLSGRFHRETLETYLELFLAAALRPAFRQEDFERLRADAINDIETTLRYSSDEELAKAVLHERVFALTRYAHPPAGTVAGLKAITLADVRAFYARHYTQGNTVLALGGGHPRDLPARMQERLQELPSGKPVPPPPPTPRLSGREVTLVSKPDADASISLGFPIDVRRGERDFYALAIANSWLGEHRNSVGRLYQSIRAARGLNYGDYSYIEAFPEGGMRTMPPPNVGRRAQLFEIWIRTLPNEHAVFALRAALWELSRLIEQGLTQEQFELTRRFLSKYVLHFADTTAMRLGYAIDDRYYGIGAPGHLARFLSELETLTRDDVNGAIRRHLGLEHLSVAIVTGDAERIAAELTSGAPSSIRYSTPQPESLLAEDRLIASWPLDISRERIRTVDVAVQFERTEPTHE